MNVNFKLFAAFLAVADHASFRKAASDLNRSLPAVSMQIKQLEDQLGVSLFHRTTRKVELTAEGEHLLISARKALAEISASVSLLQQAADVQTGRLSFACVPTVASTRLPRVLTAFAHRYPRISVSVRELSNLDLLEAVRKRDVDFAIGSVPERRDDFDFLPMFVDPYCALLPADMRSEGRKSMSLEQLAKARPLLQLSAATAFRDHVDQVIKNGGLSVERNYEFQQVSTLVAMAQAGLGVALLPQVAIPPSTTLSVVRLRPTLQRTVAVVSIRGHRSSPSASKFIEMCKELLPPDGAPKSPNPGHVKLPHLN